MKKQKFWIQVWEMVKEIVQQKLSFKPEMLLLNIMPEIIDKKIKYSLLYIFTAARLLWAQKWKNVETPTMDELLKTLLDIAELDILSEALWDQPRDFVKQSWKLIYNWTQKKTGTYREN